MSTLSDIGNLNGSSSAVTRWATFGPYYAMFPIQFAFRVIEKYSQIGDSVIDPFAGRCSAIYAAAVLGRNAVGMEINPVGWLYGKTKLNPAPQVDVIKRLKDVCKLSEKYGVSDFPEFFHYCYSPPVLKFLAAARDHLNWRRNKVDASLMAIILVNLHGKKGESLSNQMRQTKAMSPAYSVRWWKANDFAVPPVYDPLSFLTEKITWRYAKGIPTPTGKYKVYLGDSTRRLNEVARTSAKTQSKYSLLFTSPPYQGVVDYHADQWLRLWLLKETKSTDKHKRRFNSKPEYADLLDKVFGSCAKLMSKQSTVFVRTDIRKYTLDTTLEVLAHHFPKHKQEQRESTVRGISQTELFNNVSKKKEVDIILTS